MASARPLVTVQAIGESQEAASQSALPDVFLAPIRPDIVQFVHTNMRKNARQAYAVNTEAGHQHSAESWGTGRAVSRIPRVSGGGTSRAGQAAFGNMCRKGRMFAPTRIWRKWHRKINTNQKRYAVASALAASALPSLVLARGHKIADLPEVPLVIGNATESLQKTKQAIAALTAVGAYTDVEKVKASRKLRAGKGKMRNRRHVQRLGPLVVYNEDKGITKAFRNLPGVDLAQVERLNLLQLAPGGHVGRFIVWTKSAFDRLNDIYGAVDRESTQKTGYTLPQNIMSNSDLTRLINSDEIQSTLRPTNKKIRRARLKKNPLTNLGVKVRLNPYAMTLRRAELLHQKRITEGRKTKVNRVRQTQKARTANFNRINADDFPQSNEKTEEETAEETTKEEAPKAEAAKPAAAAVKPAAEAAKPAAAAAAPPKKKGSDY
jgi:large subunit ribosomal protein L4e